eukprot:3939286-Rhodomonas_salina.1
MRWSEVLYPILSMIDPASTLFCSASIWSRSASAHTPEVSSPTATHASESHRQRADIVTKNATAHKSQSPETAAQLGRLRLRVPVKVFRANFFEVLSLLKMLEPTAEVRVPLMEEDWTSVKELRSCQSRALFFSWVYAALAATGEEQRMPCQRRRGEVSVRRETQRAC